MTKPPAPFDGRHGHRRRARRAKDPLDRERRRLTAMWALALHRFRDHLTGETDDEPDF